jgi:hypothetical protein
MPGRRDGAAVLRIAVAILVLGVTTRASAQRVVAIAPLTTLDAEDRSAPIKRVTGQLEAAVATIGGTKVISTAQVTDALKRAKAQRLLACEGDVACLAELGKVVGAQVVIAGQIGGLGDAKIVYLNAIDATAAKELRATTLTLGKQDDPNGPLSAIVRLLDPSKYRGTLHFTMDVTNATVYVNGTKVALSPKNEISLEVGTQAIRITHPEYRDFVRFVDVSFGKVTEVPVGMMQYPTIRRDIQGNPIHKGATTYIDPPWYRSKYFVGGAAVGLVIVSAIIVGNLVSDLPNDPCRIIGGGNC